MLTQSGASFNISLKYNSVILYKLITKFILYSNLYINNQNKLISIKVTDINTVLQNVKSATNSKALAEALGIRPGTKGLDDLYEHREVWYKFIEAVVQADDENSVGALGRSMHPIQALVSKTIAGLKTSSQIGSMSADQLRALLAKIEKEEGK